MMNMDIPSPNLTVGGEILGRPHKRVGVEGELEENWKVVGDLGKSECLESKGELLFDRSAGSFAMRGLVRSGFGRGSDSNEVFGRGVGLTGRKKSIDDGFEDLSSRGESTERGFVRQRGFGRMGAFSYGKSGANFAPGFGRGSAKAGVSPRKMKKDKHEEDEDLPEACYAVSADKEEFGDSVNKEVDKSKLKDGKLEGEYVGRRRCQTPETYTQDEYNGYRYDNYGGYDDCGEYGRGDMESHYRQRYYGPEEEDYWGLHDVRKVGQVGREYDLSRGNRPDSRYFGPQEARRGSRRNKEAAEDTPYEGPTIFDKVFRTRKKGDDESGGRGEKERDQEMEREWRRYKERTEARIRREKEKLERYERRIHEFDGGAGEASTSARDGSKKRKRHHKKSLGNSPPRAYTNRPAYTSSESDREDSPPPPPPPPLDSPPTSPVATPITPPGTSLAPILSPILADSDKAQNKFDPY